MEDKMTNLTWETETLAFVTYHVCSIKKTEKFLPNQVLLDNQSDISIMKPELLTNVQRAEKLVHISGAGGVQFVTHDTGYLKDFFQVYASDITHANILNLAKVEDIYPVSYIHATSFIVHLPHHDIIFKRCGKHYFADWSDMYNTFVMKVFIPSLKSSEQSKLMS
jgi:hypothetical protein